MKLIEFPQQNIIIAKDQPQYNPMPAYIDDEGKVLCCWKLTFIDRLKILFSGKIWHLIMTFKTPIQPQKLMIESPFKKF